MEQKTKLSTEFEVVRDCPVLHMNGTLDAASSNLFKNEAALLFAAGYKGLVLDCSGLEFMDSSGIGSLIFLLHSIKEQGGRALWMAGCNKHVRSLLEVTQLDRQLHCTDTVGQAIDSWRLQPAY